MAQLWARVKDKTTGHHFDVTVERMQMLVDRGDAEEIPADAVHKGRHHGKPCPAKAQRRLAALTPQPAKRAAKPAVAEPKESESA